MMTAALGKRVVTAAVALALAGALTACADPPKKTHQVHETKAPPPNAYCGELLPKAEVARLVEAPDIPWITGEGNVRPPAPKVFCIAEFEHRGTKMDLTIDWDTELVTTGMVAPTRLAAPPRDYPGGVALANLDGTLWARALAPACPEFPGVQERNGKQLHVVLTLSVTGPAPTLDALRQTAALSVTATNNLLDANHCTGPRLTVPTAL
ncbi:hypothetical protein [Embleya sp. AB8]|uniref:hypothetical protein n=1 Tax=Embleya sp. AB8 TaxID=3156304 RepID=UPI003C745CC9